MLQPKSQKTGSHVHCMCTCTYRHAHDTGTWAGLQAEIRKPFPGWHGVVKSREISCVGIWLSLTFLGATLWPQWGLVALYALGLLVLWAAYV